MKILVTIIVLLALGWGAYALMNNEEVEMPSPTGTSTTYTTPASTSTPVTTTSTSTVKEFTVVGRNFSFTPATMQVNKGDRVRIIFQNQGGMHDLVVDGYGVKTKVINGGQTEVLEFVADKSGSFEYYCSVGTHRQMGMTGTLVVK